MKQHTVISLYKEVVNSKIFTHSIEQYTKREDDNGNSSVEKWFKVSVFCKEDIDIAEVKENIKKR